MYTECLLKIVYPSPWKNSRYTTAYHRYMVYFYNDGLQNVKD